MSELRINGDRLWAALMELARIGATPKGGVKRLALTDLDGVPYLHLCENRPYEVLTAAELDRVVLEVGGLGDRMERTFSAGGDLF